MKRTQKTFIVRANARAWNRSTPPVRFLIEKDPPHPPDGLQKWLDLIGKVLTTGGAASVLFGTTWTAAYFVHLGAGIPDFDKIPLASLGSMVAVAGLFTCAVLPATLTFSGLMYFPFSGRKPQAIADAKSRAIIPELGLLFLGLAASSFLSVWLIAAQHQNAWWLVLPILCGPLFGLIAARRRLKNLRSEHRGHRVKLLWREYLGPAVGASVFWYPTLLIVALLSAHYVGEQPAKPDPNAPFLLLSLFLFVSAALSFIAAQGALVLLPFMSGLVIILIAFVAPSQLLPIPFRLLHLADYSTHVLVRPENVAEMKRLQRSCPQIGFLGGDEFNLKIISSIGSSYLVQCAGPSDWITIEKRSDWVFRRVSPSVTRRSHRP